MKKATRAAYSRGPRPVATREQRAYLARLIEGAREMGDDVEPGFAPAPRTFGEAARLIEAWEMRQVRLSLAPLRNRNAFA